MAFLLGTVFAGYVYFISLYLQRVLGLAAVRTGLALVPATCTALVMATQVARRLLPVLGTKRVLLLALVLMGGGQLWLAQISATGSYQVNVLGGIMLTAAGLSLALPTVSLAIVASVPPQQRGAAGGMFVTAQQVGAAVGLAALATVAAARTGHTGSLVSGYRLSYLIATGLMLIAILAVALLLDRRKPGEPPALPGNTGRPVVEFDDIPDPQLPSTPGLRLAVHQDAAAEDQFLGVRAELRKVGELEELPQPDGLIPNGHVDRFACGHRWLTS